MGNYRKQQTYIIIALLVAVAGLGVGFAAFSATLNISSSATVTPNSDNFGIVFSSSQYAITTNNTSGTVVNGVGTNGATGGVTNLYQDSASGLVAEFTKPGQSLNITIYAHNIGEYDAYLRGVNIETIGSSYKKCTAASGTTDSLVQSACEGITVSMNVGGINYEYGSLIAEHVLSKGAVEPIIITVSYDSNSARADGNFDIEFGKISLEYSTVDSDIRLITFKVFDETFTAEAGMTWEEFINSSYNVDNRFSINSWVRLDNNSFFSDGGMDGMLRQSGSDLIIENGVYV